MNPNIINIAKKFLLNNSFYESGFKYDFLSVEFHKITFYFTINVTLPKEGQSYATPKFSYDIANILDNFSKYIGTSLSYSEKILVDGKEPIKGGVFITNEKQQEVLIAVREQVKKITIKTSIGMVSYDITWSKPDKGKFYELDDRTYLDFYFYVKIYNYTLDGKSVNPNLDMIDEIAGVTSDLMYESDSVKLKIEDIIYNVMENEIKIIKVDDLYIQSLWYIQQIDGIEVNPTMRHFNFEPGMFTSVD
jgi:hypothetical protein